MSEITPDIVAQHGLSEEEYDRVLHALGREPNLVELGIFSVMWSEHCSYKSSRLHLKKLPTEAPWVICGPGENAGVIDIGDGQTLQCTLSIGVACLDDATIDLEKLLHRADTALYSAKNGGRNKVVSYAADRPA